MKMASASKRNRYSDDEDEEIEGGFFGLISGAIRAGKAAAQAAKAAAKAAQQAAKNAAKAARDTARQTAKEARNLARQTAKEIKNAPKNLKNMSGYDKVRGAISAVETAYDIQSMVRKGEPIAPQLWNSLSPEEKVIVDIDKWQDGLSDELEELFQSLGSNQAAAFLVIRAAGQGDSTDTINKTMETTFDQAIDKLDDDELDLCDEKAKQLFGSPIVNCYEYRNGGWEWQIGMNSNKTESGYNDCGGKDNVQSDCRDYGTRDAYERRKQKIEQYNTDLRAAKLDAKQKLGLKPTDNVTFPIPEALMKELELKHNALYFQNNPLIQKAALASDFTTASGATIATLPDVYKAQAIASYMLLNEEFDYNDVSQVAPYDDWIARDINMFPSALVQMSQPEMFLDTTPYDITKQLINKIGGGTNPQRITRAQQEAFNDMTASISHLLEQIQEAKDIVEERNYLSKVEGAAAYSNTTQYDKGKIVKKDFVSYIYINDTPATGKEPPNPEYWEKLDAFSSDTMNQIEKLSIATQYVPSKKYEIGDYVAYMDETYVKMTDTPAGVLPTVVTAWAKVDILDPTAYETNKANYPAWSAATEYKVGNNVRFSGDNNYYTALQDNKDKLPTRNTDMWRRIFMYTLTEEMKEELQINQRVATYQSAVENSKEYELGVEYDIGDIIAGFDGNYYRLILQKKDADGDNLPPPRPPSKFWELVSAGEKDYSDTTKYRLYSIVKYQSKEYILVKDTPAGTKPTPANIDVWKPLDAIFEDLDPDTRALYAENKRIIDLENSDEFTYDKEGYDEGDIVTINDEYGVETVYRCIQDYSIIWNKDTDYKVGDCAIYNRKLYKKIRQADKVLPTDSTYWEPTSEEEVLKYFMTLAPPNPTYWEDTNEMSDDSQQLKLRRDAKTWNIDANPKSGIYVKNGDIVLDADDDKYYKFISSTKDRWSGHTYPDDYRGVWPIDKEYNTFGLIEPEDMEEGELLDYNMNEEEMNNASTYSPNIETRGRLWRPYRWELVADAETTRDDTYTTFEQKNKWLPNKKYEIGDYVYYKGYLFKVLKATPAGMLPMDREGNIRVDYYEWIDRESEILAVKEAYDDKVQADEDKKQEQALIAWDRHGEYTDGSFVFHEGKYYVYNDDNDIIDRNTNEPGNPDLQDEQSRAVWMNADENENVLPTEFNKKQMYPRDMIVSYNGKLYKVNNREKAPFLNGEEGTFPTPDGAESVTSGSPTPDPADPSFWMEVYPDGKPVHQLNADGKITGTNPGPTSATIASATLGVEGEEDDNENCPTGTTADDDETEEVKAKKALEKAMIEWVAKGSNPADDPRLLSGAPPPGTAPPVGTASGYTIDDLDGKKYYKNNVKPKVKRNRKNKI
jgi:hypothetical protein